MFCRVTGKEWLGIGKVVTADSKEIGVQFFVSPCSSPTLVKARANEVIKIDLSPETRVYFQDQRTGLWKAGRVLVAEDDEIRVQFPNHSIVPLNSNEVHVRCNLPIEDPIAYLISFINHTPLFSDSRRNFVKSVLDQRRACRGMSGLLSSVIELEAHQVRVVERVLKDPVQRYLLADEVGLGKTIEAGVVIRQCVLDDPDHFIVVVAPAHLVTQWRYELAKKFLLDYVLDRSVFVVAMGNTATLRLLLARAKMLVVDEVHQLVKEIDLAAPGDLYRMVCAAAHRAERLLLLSATPVFGNEASFLAMLHLLDPLIYSLADLDSFKTKIANRQPLTHLLAEISPDNVYFMEDAIDRLMAMFPGDALLQRYGTRLQNLLNDAGADEEELVEAIGTIRSHVSETYRLHRRILRNRRISVKGLTPKRDGLEMVSYRSAERLAVFTLLEQWRSAAVLSVYREEEGEVASALGEIFFHFLNALFASPRELVRLVEQRLGPRDDAYMTIPLFEGEWEILLHLKSAAVQLRADGAKLDTLRDLLKQLVATRKVIIFCTFPETAGAVASSLSESFPGKIATHHAGADFSLDTFVADPACAILVCDRSGEEGLNLHIGRGERVIVHYDLPLTPNRIEQRIGRLDRYGFPSDICCYAVGCLDDVYEMEWCQCLKSGFGVFDQSIATLQYLIESQMAGMRHELLIHGLDAIKALAGRLGGESGLLVNELHRIELQDQLDAMQDEPLEAFDDLLEMDGEWRRIEAQVDSWVERNLLFEKVPYHIEGATPPDRVFRFQYNHDRNRNTLVPLDRFMEKFLPVIDLKAKGGGSKKPRSFPFSYRRDTATAKGLQILRYGNPFIDSMMEFTSQDDRGKCFALWRYAPDYSPTEQVDHFFRFDFIVEVDLEPALEVVEERNLPHLKTLSQALRRQGDVALPPLCHTVWLDCNFEFPEAQLINKHLELPYTKLSRRDGSWDRNLNHHRWQDVWSLNLPVIKRWGEVCAAARGAALALFRKATNLDEELRRVLADMASYDAVYFAQWRSRLSLLAAKEREVEEREFQAEMELREALRRGIAEPRISLDSVGAVFLSNFTPFK